LLLLLPLPLPLLLLLLLLLPFLLVIPAGNLLFAPPSLPPPGPKQAFSRYQRKRPPQSNKKHTQTHLKTPISIAHQHRNPLKTIAEN
jgi:hypothetical protein